MTKQLNFEILNNDDIILNKSDITNSAYSNYIKEIYEHYITKGEFDNCLKFYNESNIKYLV